MNPSEYSAMAQVEDHHWWYRGLRSAFAAVWRRRPLASKEPSDHLENSVATGSSSPSKLENTTSNCTVIDAGCGTGGNLKWLRSIWPDAKLIGFDVSPEAVELTRQRVPEAQVFVADLCQPVLQSGQFELIVCSDVLYTTPLPEGLQGLRSLCQQLKSGGCLLLHLPAYNWMKSRHDHAVHTRHRFTMSEVRGMIGELGLKVEFLSYRMFLLFPLIVCLRLPSILFEQLRQCSSGDSEIRLPPEFVNRLLSRILDVENLGLRAGLRYPCGSSIIAVGRKL